MIEAMHNPKLVLTGEPLEADTSFRDRLRLVYVGEPAALETAITYKLDYIGWSHGVLRHGYRLDDVESGR